MNILQEIFHDHFEEMIYLPHPRDFVIENVEKMLNYGDPSFERTMYACPCYETKRDSVCIIDASHIHASFSGLFPWFSFYM